MLKNIFALETARHECYTFDETRQLQVEYTGISIRQRRKKTLHCVLGTTSASAKENHVSIRLTNDIS